MKSQDEKNRQALDWLKQKANEQAEKSGNKHKTTQDEINRFCEKIAETADRNRNGEK